MLSFQGFALGWIFAGAIALTMGCGMPTFAWAHDFGWRSTAEPSGRVDRVRDDNPNRVLTSDEGAFTFVIDRTGVDASKVDVSRRGPLRR
jgi:hypothetical protein